MIERRALDRIEINQLAMFHLDGVCGVHPCMVVDITIRELGFIQSRFTLPLSNLIYHWMASERQSIATWCGGTEIRAASNLSHAIRRAFGKLLGF